MTAITIKLNNKSFPVECEDHQINLVQASVEKLTERFNQLKSLSPSATTEYLLLLCAISIQSEALSGGKISTESAEIASLENTLREIHETIEAIILKMKK